MSTLRTSVMDAIGYLNKAVKAREDFYQGMREAALQARQKRTTPTTEKYRFGESVVAKNLIADNKWHMAQARTFALIAIARGVVELVDEQRQTNRTLTEIRNALRSR